MITFITMTAVAFVAVSAMTLKMDRMVEGK